MGIHEASGGLKQYALILIVAMLIYSSNRGVFRLSGFSTTIE